MLWIKVEKTLIFCHVKTYGRIRIRIGIRTIPIQKRETLFLSPCSVWIVIRQRHIDADLDTPAKILREGYLNFLLWKRWPTLGVCLTAPYFPHCWQVIVLGIIWNSYSVKKITRSLIFVYLQPWWTSCGREWINWSQRSATCRLNWISLSQSPLRPGRNFF